jgi:hypothetical protein
MIITIAKINRQLREGISKKTNKPYSFESLGIAPKEDTLMDINGDEFLRDGRWLSGSSVKGVTETWAEGDKVKINLVRTKVTGKDGNIKEVINFKLPDGVEPMVQKFVASPEPTEEDIDPDNF